jgi:type I restriction enzyme M protein
VKGNNTNALFIDASKHYESVKNQNRLRPADIEHIVDTYRKFNEGKLTAGISEDKYSYVARFDKTKENDFNLNIPRYFDTFEEEPEVDVKLRLERLHDPAEAGLRLRQLADPQPARLCPDTK